MSGHGAGDLWGAVWHCAATCSPGSLPRRDHCARGWSFLSLLSGFFPPSTTLMPYVTKFLQDSGPSQGAGGSGRGGAWEAGNCLGRGLDTLASVMLALCRARPDQPGAPPAYSQVWGASTAAPRGRNEGFLGTGSGRMPPVTSLGQGAVWDC